MDETKPRLSLSGSYHICKDTDAPGHGLSSLSLRSFCCSRSVCSNAVCKNLTREEVELQLAEMGVNEHRVMLSAHCPRSEIPPVPPSCTYHPPLFTSCPPPAHTTHPYSFHAPLLHIPPSPIHSVPPLYIPPTPYSP